jgi:hypothetical protein
VRVETARALADVLARVHRRITNKWSLHDGQRRLPLAWIKG